MEFITPDEKAQLETKLRKLIDNRPVLSRRIQEARELGDLKENADYHAAREEQGLEEAEIRRLEERLATAKVVEGGKISEEIVFIGATVRIREVGDDEEELFKLVGEPSGAVSDEIVEVTVGSPMGASLMKARVGDTIRVDLPRGPKRFEILAIL
ncbi:MAG: transcription elongation factor GreA [Phycisphaeraceae bacterium]|nr:transcription elongation factor GreA [Phycisphaeraceae bacterium]